MSRLIYAIFLLAGFLLMQSRCGNNADAAKEGDKVLARVYDRSLYSSELEGVVPPGTPQADSMLIVSAYVQRWLRDQLLMYEAERNIPKDLNIDKLVRDYRASLVRFNFEQQIIVEKLDSTLNDAELQAYYENNKDQFQLESTILKCVVIKLPSSASQSDMNKLWNSRKPADEERLAAFANQWASLALLDREKWYRLDDVAALLPKGTLNTDNIDSRREGTVSEGDYKYYYRVLEVVRGKEPAPFDYVRDQIANVILHKRKQELLERWKEDLYQKELQRENIKIMQ
ncbi:MAG: hypothetical protein JNL02_00665 [Saprospiraceae bacterium]|nr:hypothetical protein [Saprospiraceae bacterium]